MVGWPVAASAEQVDRQVAPEASAEQVDRQVAPEAVAVPAVAAVMEEQQGAAGSRCRSDRRTGCGRTGIRDHR